ncbi:hypothetical protein ACPOL_2119 [Acidisarcina polymorpha]|uniref:HTH crp-type domain-containing protein n=2 Tax=Acidisarcina polymorpha TaxID=2211140 RepID=A0A2Z5FX29_9BACT|nr:hypothetical protein ACPOL_2119 [Acidisarcina polymorpha]
MTSGLTSIVAYMSNGSGTEVGIVGSEGVVESFHLLSSPSVQNVQTRGWVQIAGTAMRMRFSDAYKEFLSSEVLRTPVLGFVQCQGSILGQLAACNRLHDVEERLARWLLMVQDRVGGEVLPLTQELLAIMLGARRSSVTLAASDLQRRGLIEYHRGQVKIMQRDLLENAACECYSVTRRLFANLYLQ